MSKKERTYTVKVKKNVLVMDWPPGNLDGKPEPDGHGGMRKMPKIKKWRKGDIIEDMPVSIIRRHMSQLEVYLGDPTLDDSPLPEKEKEEELKKV